MAMGDHLRRHRWSGGPSMVAILDPGDLFWGTICGMTGLREGSDTFGNLVRLLRNHWKSQQKSLEIRKSGFTPEILNEIKS